MITSSNFSTADDVRQSLGIEMRLAPRRSAAVEPITPSPWLPETLERGRANRSNTEKARSEWLITPVLIEREDQVPAVAVFSGRPLRGGTLSSTPDHVVAANTGALR